MSATPRAVQFDAEGAVVGGVLLDAGAYWRVADLLTADDFEEPACRRLWAVVGDLAKAGEPFDFITIGARDPSLERIATQIAARTASAANIRAHAQLVAKRSLHRKVRLAGERIAHLPEGDALTEAQRLLGACVPRMDQQVRRASEYTAETMREIIARSDPQAPRAGIPTGLPLLDELTGGWQPGDLIVVGARPSVGKTAFALQSLLHAASVGHHAHLASLEMTGRQIVERSLAHLGRINPMHIREPSRMLDDEWPRLTSANQVLNGLPFWIDEGSSMPLDALCARIRQQHARHKLRIAAIDYLTYIQPPRAENVTEGVQIITRTLKGLAKDLAIPLLLLSQLTREGDETPTLRTLRNSGAIEQDADVAILLSHPVPNRRDLVLCDLAKQRNGPRGEVWLRAQMNQMRFDETDERPKRAAGPGFKGKGGNPAADRAAGDESSLL